MKKARWVKRPPNSNWGEFGPDDQHGRMNWVTREKVLQGVAEVKEGLTFVLSLPLDYSTQWDSFAHVGALFDADADGKPEPVFYNGFRAGEHIKPAKENPQAEPWAKFEGT